MKKIKTFWAEIPGRMNVNDTKSFYIFECSNPEDVAAGGSKPVLTEVGPFSYQYIHKLERRVYSEENGAKDGKVSYVKEFQHKYIGDPKILNKEYRVLNLAGLKKWQSVKNKSRFQIAIEGFFELFFYARNNLLRDMVIKDLVKHYSKAEAIYELTKFLNLPMEVVEGLAFDHYYGLLIESNVYEWSVMCDTYEPYIEHEIMTYFGFSIPTFEVIRFRFCDDYLLRRDALNQTYCRSMTYCSGYNLTFNQWMYANIVNGKTYKDITMKPVYGLFEFPLFEKEFFKKLNPEFREQFSKVKWPDKGLHYLLDTLYEFPDYKTDEASLLLYENMKRLFEAGRLTHNPFRMSNQGLKSSELDLSKFERIAEITKLTREQAFMMYSYFDYFVNNTVLLHQLGGTEEKERIAHHGAHSLWDIASYCFDYLDVVIYSRAIRTRHPTKTCEEAVQFFFKIQETEEMMGDLSKAICNNMYFHTDLTDPVGWKYFIEANAFPYKYYYHRLLNYLSRTVEHFNNETLDAMLFKAHSPYWTILEDIKRKVKIHYQKVSQDTACENKFSPFCSKRQLFADQFHDSIITQFPYPESHLPASSSISDWWIIIKPYMDWTINNGGNKPRVYDPTPLPDQEIEVPVEFNFLKRYYGNTDITKVDLYNCLHGYGLYDTDFLFNVFLNIKSPSKLPICQKFASNFFFNSTRYLLRNVEFGPLFDLLEPNLIFFGYYNWYIEVEHQLVDYLQGDDCTVNPWIGYNPTQWNMEDRTFEHLLKPIVMLTGSQVNKEIRKYKSYYGDSTITYRKLVVDETGDQCPFETRNPFAQKAFVSSCTDGFQFDQSEGKSEDGDKKYIIDSHSQHPMKIYRPNDRDYKYRDLDIVNPYIIDFVSEYGCEKGVYLRNSFDMTSFFQMRSIVTRAQLNDIFDPHLNIPKITYTRPLDLERPPEAIRPCDSYFIIEPYTGITLKSEKKLMTSMVLYYDELYDKLPEKGIGEILPYYSTFEYYKVRDAFVDGMTKEIKQAIGSRYAIMAAFTTIGLLFVLAAIAMISRAFFFDISHAGQHKKDENKESLVGSSEVKVEIKQEETAPKETTQKMLIEGEDLQKDIKEAKVENTPSQ